MENIWSKTEAKEQWVFPDSVNLPIIGLFKGISKEISKNGATEFFLLKLENAGTTFKITLGFSEKQVAKKINMQKVIEKYPKQEDVIDKYVKLSIENGMFYLVPIEQDFSQQGVNN